MKIVRNNIIPCKGFRAMYFFGLLFVRKGVTLGNKLLRHERIHHEQAKEMLFIFFYLWYIVEWFIRLFINGKRAYRNISFEREAYAKQRYSDYIGRRKHYKWLHYIFVKSV
jgi:hypothetical protein